MYGIGVGWGGGEAKQHMRGYTGRGGGEAAFVTVCEFNCFCEQGRKIAYTTTRRREKHIIIRSSGKFSLLIPNNK